MALPCESVPEDITTAPGAAKTKPKSEDTRAIIKPAGHIWYSAMQPSFLAMKRCPISWRIKPKETLTTAMRQTMSKPPGSEKAWTPPERAMPNATARRSVEISKSLNSLNFIAEPGRSYSISHSHCIQPCIQSVSAGLHAFSSLRSA